MRACVDVTLLWCTLQPLRSKFCKHCQARVCTYDHHCFMIGTCIGERNHCRFWWLLMTTSITLCICIVVVRVAVCACAFASVLLGTRLWAGSPHCWAHVLVAGLFAGGQRLRIRAVLVGLDRSEPVGVLGFDHILCSFCCCARLVGASCDLTCVARLCCFAQTMLLFVGGLFIFHSACMLRLGWVVGGLVGCRVC